MSLEKSLAYEFKNKDLLRVALTHKSYFHERDRQIKDVSGIHGHNEKLEFLGDAVVDLSVSQILMQKFPKDGEGNLSKKRASLVNETVLAEVAMNLGLSQQLILGKGEILSGGDKKPRLLASAFEALMGAIFVESGFDEVHRCVQLLLEKNIENLSQEVDFGSDFKTRLQEIVQSELKAAPTYRLVSESGPSHDRVFEVEVNIQEYPPTKGVGKSKKSAEQEAARLCLQIWNVKEKS